MELRAEYYFYNVLRVYLVSARQTTLNEDTICDEERSKAYVSRGRLEHTQLDESLFDKYELTWQGSFSILLMFLNNLPSLS